MTYAFETPDAEQWITEQFAQARLGDRRRAARVRALALAWLRQPGKSLTALFERLYDLKAAYTFFQRPEATADNIQAGHRAALHEKLAQSGGVFVLPEDTTDLSWSGNAPIAGLGPIGNGAPGLQGIRLHSVLALRWPGADPDRRRPAVEILGVLDQQYDVRPPKEAKKTAKKARKKTKKAVRPGASRRRRRPRESEIWARTSRRLGPAPAGVRWVRVCDREADIFEFLQSCEEQGHGYVVRATQDRCLEDLATGEKRGYLFETLRDAPARGQFTLHLRARPGQPAREARVTVAGVRVALAPPRGVKGPAVLCTAVRVFEIDPDPAVEEPLEWILLTDAPDLHFEALREVAQQYASRWLIEEFHKALKSGVGAEKLQLETKNRLEAAIAVMSVVAVRLVELREAVQRDPDAPAAAAGLTAKELRVLSARLNRPLATVRDVALALGRLGGHLNRPSDGLPGWQTLWKGYRELRVLVHGVELAERCREGPFQFGV